MDKCVLFDAAAATGFTSVPARLSVTRIRVEVGDPILRSEGNIAD